MRNFEKYIGDFSLILKEHMNINNVPDYLYAIIKNMNPDELSAFLMSNFKDLSPKKLNDFQKNELRYMFERRKKNLLHNQNGWYADDVLLVEEYPQFMKDQEYNIELVLDADTNAVVFADKMAMNRNYLELPYVPTQNTNVEFKFEGVKDIKQIFNRTLFGVRGADHKNRFSLIISNTGDLFVDIGIKRNTLIYNINDMINNSVTVKLIDKQFSIQINNSEPVNFGIMTFTDFTSPLNFIFGALKTGEAVTSAVQIDLNYLKVYDKTRSIFIKPAYNKDGEVVLYNLVSQTEIEMRKI